ncbi:MAG: hypothetical protein H0U13_08110 [Gemmatimonadaceae bacterium]|nr:hypothetical protein [Gemmatimonadaceae bacterium]
MANRLGIREGAFGAVSLCVFPQTVGPVLPYAMWRILDALSIDPAPYDPWKHYDLCVCFEDHTTEVIDVKDYFTRSSMLWINDEITGEWRHERNQVGRFINAGCKDISKQHVGRVFENVFGYPLDVDPRTYPGPIVRKANANASHDGKLIEGPVSEAEYHRDRHEFVYCVHIDNIRDDVATDFRLMWFGHLSPMLHRKERLVSARFSRGARAAFLEPVATHFSASEIDAIGTLCREFGLDYGELDCLRDKGSGRIYVVDINKTPASRLLGMSTKDATEAVVCLATGFAEGFLVGL